MLPTTLEKALNATSQITWKKIFQIVQTEASHSLRYQTNKKQVTDPLIQFEVAMKE